MADHYFSAEPQSQSRPMSFTKGDLRFQTDAGVFSREHMDRGSELLAETVDLTEGRGLDLGCGYGAVGLTLAARAPKTQWVLTDINSRAAGLARQNAEANGITNVQVCCADGFAAVEGLFDCIATNPPIRAGKALIFGWFAQCPAYLNPGGRLYVVMRKAQGAPSAKAKLAEIFGNCETVARDGGFHILCAKNMGK